MDEWNVGDPADWGDSVGVPDIPYMGYLQDDDDEKDSHPHMTHSQRLVNEAWRLRQDCMLDEALDKINKSLETCGSGRAYNIKAIILEDMGDYEGALYNYKQALQRKHPPIVPDNLARLYNRMAESGRYSKEKSLDYINKALDLTKDESDRLEFLATKSDVLKDLGRHREAYVCNKLSNKQFNLVDEFETQSKILQNTDDTFICITGRKFYGYSAPTRKGTVIDLIKEPENQHDPDAIRVEYNGDSVGYVANANFTLIDEASSASDIKGLFEDKAKAEILFIYMEEHLVARLI